MPTCKKCKTAFPNRLTIGGKTHVINRRKFCLVCSPFGSHNTKPIEILPKNGDHLSCSKCQKDYIFGHNGGTSKHCPACSTGLRRIRVKEKAIAVLGGRCWECGYSRCRAAMEFHHINPDTKKFGLNDSTNRKWLIFEAEIRKCALLCCLCHREVESGLIQCPIKPYAAVKARKSLRSASASLTHRLDSS